MEARDGGDAGSRNKWVKCGVPCERNELRSISTFVHTEWIELSRSIGMGPRHGVAVGGWPNAVARGEDGSRRSGASAARCAGESVCVVSVAAGVVVY